MNQLFDVMQSADVVIGIGARFSLGNPAGNASTLANINVPFGDMPIPRAPQLAPVYHLPWTQPQDGLIES